MRYTKMTLDLIAATPLKKVSLDNIFEPHRKLLLLTQVLVSVASKVFFYVNTITFSTNFKS